MGEVKPLRKPPTLSAPTALTAEHDISQFSCGEVALDNWLRERAKKSEGRFARTYVVCVGNRVIAYFCLVGGSVDRHEAPKKLQRNAPNAVPVAILGRLAVDEAFAGQGIGRDLVQDAFVRIVSASKDVAISAIMVHAKDAKALAFYMRCAEFLEYPADSRILFLPIETIKAAIVG